MALNKQTVISIAVYAGSFAIGIAAAIGVNKLTNAYHNSYKQRRKRVIDDIKDVEYDNKEQVILMACYERELKELQYQKATLAIDDPTSGEKIEIIELKIEAVKKNIIHTYQVITSQDANICRVENKYNLTDEEIDELIKEVEQKYNEDYSVKAKAKAKA